MKLTFGSRSVQSGIVAISLLLLNVAPASTRSNVGQTLGQADGIRNGPVVAATMVRRPDAQIREAGFGYPADSYGPAFVKLYPTSKSAPRQQQLRHDRCSHDGGPLLPHQP